MKTKPTDLGKKLQKMMDEMCKVSKSVPVSAEQPETQTCSARRHIQKFAEQEVK
jgi:hypothetical protein